MKDREMIVRLRELRKLREQRTKETVLRRQTAASSAAMCAREASQSTAAYLEQIEADEQAAFGSLVGQSVNAVGLLRVQGQFERAAEETMRLRVEEKIAKAAESECRAELSGARDNHRSHLKAVAKVDGLLERMATRTAGRRMSIAELCDEEDYGPAHTRESR